MKMTNTYYRKWMKLPKLETKMVYSFKNLSVLKLVDLFFKFVLIFCLFWFAVIMLFHLCFCPVHLLHFVPFFILSYFSTIIFILNADVFSVFITTEIKFVTISFQWLFILSICVSKFWSFRFVSFFK